MNALWVWLTALPVWAWIAAHEWWKLVLPAAVAVTTLAGAVTAMLSLWDRFTKRKLSVDRSLTSAVDIGNTVWINNASDQPQMIVAWDIIWARWRPWGRIQTNLIHEADFDDDGFTIAPHQRQRFDFSEEDYFKTDAAVRQKYGKLYVRLWTIGAQRAKWFRLL